LNAYKINVTIFLIFNIDKLRIAILKKQYAKIKNYYILLLIIHLKHNTIKYNILHRQAMYYKIYLSLLGRMLIDGAGAWKN